MSVRIKIKNFQSIADATLEVKGFTVVTGTNNTGKSAAVRAIRAAFQNTKGSSFVRYRQPSTSVEVEFGDGNSVQWEKGKDVKPTYRINGSAPIYPGQGTPDELKALKVTSIQAGGREFWPQLAPQFDGQVFLLDQPGSVLAEAVADVQRVGQLNEALRGVESDRRAAASELKVRQADALRYGQRLKDFEGLDDIVKQVEDIEKSKERATLIARATEGLTFLLSRKQKAHRIVLKLQDIESIEIPSDEKFLILRNLLKEQAELTVLLNRKQHAQQSICHFEGLDEVQFELNTERAERILAAIRLVEGLLKRRQVAETQIRSIEQELSKTEKELVQVTENLKDLLGDYSECPLCGSALDTHSHGEESCISEDSLLRLA